MTVMFKSKANILEQIGLSDPYVKAVSEAGYNVTYGIYNLIFTHPSLGPKELNLVVSIDSLVKGAPTVISKTAIGALMHFIISDLGLMPKLTNEVLGSALELLTNNSKASAKTQTSNIPDLIKQKAKATAKTIAINEGLVSGESHYTKGGATPLAGLSTKIPLVEAKELYQLVSGTGAASKYITVAIHPYFAVAVKLDGENGLSIRVEGSINSKLNNALLAQGITKKGNYYSGHFNLNKVPPTRALGAILFGLGVDFTKVISGTAKLEEMT